MKAVRALVEAGGYEAATVEAIAARSGVAKTTIYRSWPNRAALVVELLMEMARVAVPEPSGPNPLGAVRAEMRGIAAASDHLMGRLLTSILGEAQRDPEIRAAILGGLFLPRSAATGRMLRRAQQAGQLRADISSQFAVDLLVGPLFYRMFVRHRPPTAAFASQVFRAVMTGLGPRDAVYGRGRKRPPQSRRRAVPRRTVSEATRRRD